MQLRLVAVALFALPRAVAADGPPPPTDTFPYHRGGPTTFDVGLVVGAPAALPTGLTTGVGGGVSRDAGWLRLGARLAWSTATEATAAWTVSHDDVRVRVGASATIFTAPMTPPASPTS